MRQQRSQYERESAYGRHRTGLASGLSLLGGAGLGAVLMYLLDPEAGARRRSEWGERATRAASTTGTVFGNLAHTAGNVAGNVWDMTTETGRTMAERAGETAHGLRKGARRQMHAAHDTASGWFGREEKHSYVPRADTVVSAAAALAAGVGLMYLLDPTDGARRRSLLLDKTRRCLNETGEFFRRTGRHLANRSRGMAHETRAMFQRDEASDRTIAERIRSRIGHLQQQSTVNVAVIDGRVTLTGRCSPDDVDALLSTVQGTPGVSSIVNLLDVQSTGAPPYPSSATT